MYEYKKYTFKDHLRAFLDEVPKSRKVLFESILRREMPYCAHKRIGSADELILVNRNYKPLGEFRQKFHVNYSDQKYDWLSFKVDDDLREKMIDIVLDGRIFLLSGYTRQHKAAHYKKYGSYWFFDDSCPPWRDTKNLKAYLNRCKAFLSLVHI